MQKIMWCKRFHLLLLGYPYSTSLILPQLYNLLQELELQIHVLFVLILKDELYRENNKRLIV